ncbi:MAG TPA: response regulator [Candidatus Krumholzibacteria bacterium]|nr:response regulator [Candidatus Krumholzibacteria bacterium]HPD70928.1 response regulator [Candidatus Krumholzibacteria bacterium]HRY39372.1 response regulator [Candidatus Krumholzibacteria bacterium]
MRKILVCDDDANIRNIMEFSLEAEGFLVVSAADGDEARRLAASEQPDLVILDIMMPGSDGLAVCRELKQQARTKHLPVLLLTARAGKKDREAGLAAGADDYITKPFSPQRLVDKVHGILGVRH